MRNALEDTIEMTAEERSFIDRFTADYCRPHPVVVAERLAAFVKERQMKVLFPAGSGFALAAGESASTASVEAPDEEVRFVFASEGDADAAGSWRAELVVPPRAKTETMLALSVVDRTGAAAAGVFTLAGVSLPLVAGRAEMPFGLFLAGIKDTDVSLTGADGRRRSGRLLFF